MRPLRQRRERYHLSPGPMFTAFVTTIIRVPGTVRLVYGAEPVRARGPDAGRAPLRRVRSGRPSKGLSPAAQVARGTAEAHVGRIPEIARIGRPSVRSGVFGRFCLLCASVARDFTACDSRGAVALFDDLAGAVLMGASMILLALIFRRGHVLRFSSSRGSGIRTHGRVIATGFQDQRIRPLCHAPQQIFLAEIIRSSYQATTIGSGSVRDTVHRCSSRSEHRAAKPGGIPDTPSKTWHGLSGTVGYQAPRPPSSLLYRDTVCGEGSISQACSRIVQHSRYWCRARPRSPRRT
jgi:hypothetical protein